MLSPKPPQVHDIKLSSVGPSHVTGRDVVHEPTNIDLAMKLHYIRAVYYYTALELTTLALKEVVFCWLNRFPFTCGRFKRASSGRAHIKCNDCGARFVEAQCRKTVEEWVEMLQEDGEIHNLLVPDNVIGPELEFSPLIYIQLTRFKCGGISIGLSWAHVLGDVFSVVDFMNALGQAMSGQDLGPPNKQSQHTSPQNSSGPLMTGEKPLSVKQVGPVGDHWINAHTRKMAVFSINLTTTKMTKLQHKVIGDYKIPPFEFLCGFIWKIVANIRIGHEPKVVTVCKNDPLGRQNFTLGNHQVISVVEADFNILETSPKELSKLLATRAIDERTLIEEAMERDKGLSDFAVYGANLTFVDLEDADFYGFELKEQKPAYASCIIDGVGEAGVILVIPGRKNDSKDGIGGKVVTLIMPEDEVLELKCELKRAFSIA